MAVIPHTIDVVVADMGKALALPQARAPRAGRCRLRGAGAGKHPGGATLGFLTEAMMKGHNPYWIDPVGQRVTFACRCDDAGEVDATYARVTAAGYEGRQEPWDAPWGQRYAMLGDPDGNRVDLFAAIAPAGEE